MSGLEIYLSFTAILIFLPSKFDNIFNDVNIKIIKTPPQSPNCNCGTIYKTLNINKIKKMAVKIQSTAPITGKDAELFLKSVKNNPIKGKPVLKFKSPKNLFKIITNFAMFQSLK